MCYSSVYRLCLLGHAEMQQLHFALAERYFTEAMQLAERYAGPQSISAALCAPMIAQFRYEQGRLDEAEALLLDLMPVIDLAVMLDSVLIAYRVLIRIAVARSNPAHAYALLDRAQALGHKRGWQRLLAAALVERTRLHLREGRMTEASACVAQLDELAAHGAAPVASRVGGDRELSRARGSLRRDGQNRSARSRRSLRPRGKAPSADTTIISRCACAPCSRLPGWARANAARPLRSFGEVVKDGRARGASISRFSIRVEQIGPLLQALRDDTRNTAQTRDVLSYIDRLLDGWRALYQPDSASRRDAEREPLSARERNIVELIAQGLSNKEIARDLGIAPETVKSHVKNIFVKLAVDKRAHAVARAQASRARAPRLTRSA